MSAATAISLVPPLEPIQDAVQVFMPRMVSVNRYLNSIREIHNSDYTAVRSPTERVHIPNPFARSPRAQAAIDAAKSRIELYSRGGQLFFQWGIQQLSYTRSFDPVTDQLVSIFQQFRSGTPTPAQRTEVLALFEQLIAPLRGLRQVLLDAEKAYLAALPGMREDERDLGAGAASMNEAIAAFESNFQSAMIKYTMDPLLRGLAVLLQETAAPQLKSLRDAQSGVNQAAGYAAQAAESVAILAGHFLVLLTRYDNVADTLRNASDAAFVDYLNSIQLDVAKRVWAAYDAYIMKNLLGA